MTVPAILETGIAALLDAMTPAVVNYADAAPQDTAAPFTIFQEIDADSDQWDHLQGPAGIVDSRMQVSAYATTKLEAVQMAGRINEKLNGFRGLIAGVQIRSCRRVGRQAAREDQTDPKLFVVNQDFQVTYTEN